VVVPVLLLKESNVKVRFLDGDELACHSPADWAKFQNVVRLKLISQHQEGGSIATSKLASAARSVLEFQQQGLSIRFAYDQSPLEISYQLYEIFFMGEYAALPVADRMVVDIGANIGDSSIYFAKRGADHVYALEASPGAHRRAAENIELNHLGERITLCLAACGHDVGWTQIVDQGVTPGSWTPPQSARGVLVEKMNLDAIVNRFGITHAVLKVDCEGCEYALFRDAHSPLAAFDDILVEYHYGPEEIEVELRAAGFEIVYCTHPMRVGGARGPGTMFSGTVYATRSPRVRPS